MWAAREGPRVESESVPAPQDDIQRKQGDPGVGALGLKGPASWSLRQMVGTRL